MADDNSQVLTCSECGDVFHRPKPTGQIPGRCPPCKLAARRSQALKYARRVLAERWVQPQMQFTCVDCEQSFRRRSKIGKPPERCEECRRARNREVARVAKAARASAAKRKRASDARPPSCFGCGADVPDAAPSRRRLLCMTCKRERRRAYHLRTWIPAPAWPPIVCADCGTSVPTKKGQRQRCGACALKRHNGLARQWTVNNRERRREHHRRKGHLRRARMRGAWVERFSSREIYARDGWRCKICRKKMSPGFRFPHPMSATIDHIVPISEGGPHTRANCRAAHFQCNSRRGNRGGDEQLALIG